MTVIYNMSIDWADKTWIGDRRFTEGWHWRGIAASHPPPRPETKILWPASEGAGYALRAVCSPAPPGRPMEASVAGS